MIDIDKWNSDDGDNTLRLNYPLNETSIVFDVGGYFGQWSEKIYQKYKCKIFIFEPIKKYFDNLNEKFSTTSNIKTYNFGLSNKDFHTEIILDGDGSSIYSKEECKDKEKIFLKNILTFIDENNIKNIDLLKLNVEGEEYNILDCLIELNYVKNIKNIQVQFHKNINNFESRRLKIRKNLEESHKMTYNYEYIWENWQAK
jgi:FkbM family methyltransferase